MTFDITPKDYYLALAVFMFWLIALHTLALAHIHTDTHSRPVTHDCYHEPEMVRIAIEFTVYRVRFHPTTRHTRTHSEYSKRHTKHKSNVPSAPIFSTRLLSAFDFADLFISISLEIRARNGAYNIDNDGARARVCVCALECPFGAISLSILFRSSIQLPRCINID